MWKILLLLLFPILLSAQVVNVESKRIITDTTGWSGGVGLNFSLIQNKKRLFIMKSKAHVQWKPVRKNLFLLLGEYGLTKGDNNVFQDYGFGHLRWTSRLTKLFALETFAQAQYNKINNLTFRGLLGFGPRYELVSQPHFKVFVASLAMLEKNVEVDGDVWQGARFSSYVSFSYHPNKLFKLVNTTYYQPKMSAFSDFRLSGESKMEWAIYQRLKFVSTFYYSHDAFPPEGVPKQSYRMNNGIKFVF